ncbi:MAG: MFS transporter [Oceanococcus sp.]
MNTFSTLGIQLVPGVRPRHLWCYLLVAIISSAYAGALAVLQPGLLHAMGIPHGEQATLTGNLAALQELVFILLLGPIGALADRVGRRLVYTVGLLLTGLGYTLYAHAGSVNELIALRLIVALGSAAVIGMMVTVIADYPQEQDRGKANGLQGLVATLGAFVAPMLLPLPALFAGKGMDQLAAQQATFAVAGSLGAFAAVIAAVGLSGQAGRVERSAQVPLKALLAQGIKSTRDPAIALACAAAFTSRGVLAVTGAFMSLWLVQYGTAELNMSASDAMNKLALPRVLMIVSGALVGAILMGFISDRVRRVTAVALASGVTTVVYTSLFMVDDPTAPWVFVLLGLMGIAEISAFVSSQALVGQQAPAVLRGVIIGFFGMAGAVGILVGTTAGGYMFRDIGPSAPFIMFGAINAVVCVWALLLRRDPDQMPLKDAEAAA